MNFNKYENERKEVDIIIVGAGASGAAAAWNLTKQIIRLFV